MQTNIIHNCSCERMMQVDDESVDLIVSSPPYFNLREYSSWSTYDGYLGWVRSVICECYRVLKPNGWICWNIQECIPNQSKSDERLGCYPLLAHTINVMEAVGLLYEKDIIWYKGKGTATQKLFGTYPRPGLILVSGLTEHIITVRKPKNGYKKKVSDEIVQKSKLSKKEWGEWAVDLWDIPPVNSKRIAHPAPFPLGIPYRLIRLYSFWGDVVLDPCMGSGQTAMAAAMCGRKYIGYELNAEYIENAEARLRADVDLAEMI